jgi:hypothetical protein
VGQAEIGPTVLGSRIATSGDCATVIRVYFQNNGPEQVLYSMADDSEFNEVNILSGGGGTVPGIELVFEGSSAPHVPSGSRSGFLLLCLVTALWLSM